jgi:putative transcriptional regulator
MRTLIGTLRNKAGLTQEELAAHADVTRQTIIALEAGRYNPSLLLAWKITKALGKKHIEEVFLVDK